MPKVIRAHFVIEDEIDGEKILKNIERYGRVCYKSEDKITADSARRFIRRIIDSGHESVIEHEKVTIRVICDRGVTHEIVRHRIASYSQESTRYCDYHKSGEISVIYPLFLKKNPRNIGHGKRRWSPARIFTTGFALWVRLRREARSVLPNSLKTEIVITYNLREWRHFSGFAVPPAPIRRCGKSRFPF